MLRAYKHNCYQICTCGLIKRIYLNNCLAETNAMEGENRVEVICNLFSKCKFHEQQTLLNELLPLYLKRDFLALVPFAVIPIILQFITLTDIFSCLLVCKAWNTIINECIPYWKHMCRVIGMSRLIDNCHYPTAKQLALTGVKYQTLVKSCCLESNPISLCYGSYLIVPIGCWLPNQELFLTFSIRNVSIVEGGAKSVLCRTAVDQSFRVLWYNSSPTSKHVSWLGNDGTFHRWCLNSDLSTWTLLQVNHKIISLAEYHINCCSDCSLVFIAPKSFQNSSLWNIELLYLDKHHAGVSQHAIQFLPNEHLRNNPLYKLHAAVLKPVSAGPKQRNKCSQHNIFLQFGSAIVVYRYGNTGVFEHLQTLSSTDDIQCASVSGHKFQVSSNGDMVGIVLNGRFHQWSLSNSSVFVKKTVDLVCKDFFSPNANCLAIGKILSILNLCNRLAVVVTETGAVLNEYSVARGASPTFEFLPPYDQCWLNELLLSCKKLELLHVINRAGVIVQEFSTVSFALTT